MFDLSRVTEKPKLYIFFWVILFLFNEGINKLEFPVNIQYFSIFLNMSRKVPNLIRGEFYLKKENNIQFRDLIQK